MVDAQEGDAMSGAKGVVQLGPLRRTGGPLNHAVYDLLKSGCSRATTRRARGYRPTICASSSV